MNFPHNMALGGGNIVAVIALYSMSGLVLSCKNIAILLEISPWRKSLNFFLSHGGATVCVIFPLWHVPEKESNVCTVSCSVLTHTVHSCLAEDQRSMVRDGFVCILHKAIFTQKIHVMLLVKSTSLSHGTLFTVLLSFVRYEGIS